MPQRRRPTELRIAALPKNFDPVKHLAESARTKADARFFGNTLGKRGEYVFVETDEGVYQFKQEHIKGIRPLHKELDMLTISREASFVMHGNIARSLRVSAAEEYHRVTDQTILEMANNNAPLREIVDTLGGLGTREWRG
jgi:hypothetical protein